MQIEILLLVIISSIIILSVLIIGQFFPELMSAVSSYKIAGLVFVITSISCWYITQQIVVCSLGDPGTCQSDKNCSNNGNCLKDSDGKCGCVCDSGYSGQNCETIEWDSSHCMGPNSKWVTRKGNNGECLCPNDNWADGIDPKFGYVKCLKCAGNWGPLDGNSPCSGVWDSSNYLSTDCYAEDKKSIACNEYESLAAYNGPDGKKGSISILKFCNEANQLNSCRCPQGSKNSRALCGVTGFLDPTKPNETCENSINERPCSGYKCIN